MHKGEEYSRSALDKAGELEKILDNTPFLLTRCSHDLRYVYVSKAYATMIRRASDEIAGKPIIEIMGLNGFETIRPYVESVLQGQRVEFEAEIDFTGIGPRQLRVIYVPERDDQSHVVGWIASIIDISEPSKATEEKEQLKKHAILTLRRLTSMQIWLLSTPDEVPRHAASWLGALALAPENSEATPNTLTLVSETARTKRWSGGQWRGC